MNLAIILWKNIYYYIYLIIYIIFSLGGINSLMLGEYEEGQRYFIYAGEDGKLSLIDLHAEEPNAKFDAEKSVKFILHTRYESLF